MVDATGACQIISDNGSNIQITQSILTAGKRYRLTVIVRAAASGTARLYNGTTLILLTSVGTFTTDFTAANANLTFLNQRLVI
jgi:hypothetical protein